MNGRDWPTRVFGASCTALAIYGTIWICIEQPDYGWPTWLTVAILLGSLWGLGPWLLWAARPVQAKSWYIVRNGYVTGTIDHEGDGSYRARSLKQEARALGLSRSVIGAWLLIVRHQRAVRLDRKCRNCGCNR